MKTHDCIVIGGGSGGYAAARTAKEFVDDVAIVDGADELGGLCILRGCMPSKTLIYSAEVLHLARLAKEFGLDIPEAKVDMPALHQRKLDTIAEFSEYRQEQLESDRFTLYRSRAKFLDANTIELADGTQLRSERFVLGTGSKVNTPPVPGLADVPVWTSRDILDLDFLPESVIVLGGGVVACELAQFLSRIGTKVTQIQRSAHILKEGSQQASEVVEKVFAEEGLELHTDTSIQEIAQDGDDIVVTFTQGSETHTAKAKHLFNALGRSPNTEGLDLEKAGVELLPSGHVQTNENQQTTNPRIYAVGDVAGPHEIVHVAILQGELAGRHAFGQSVMPINYDHLTGVVFTDPQIAYVGIPEAQLKERGIDYFTEDYPFDDHGKSILMEAKHGFVKIIAERPTGRILAAECVSKDASELIHALAVAVALEATVHDLLKVHWYHPTLAEIWTYPLEDIADELG